jgi:transglutaminase-like putative cysteine protease
MRSLLVVSLIAILGLATFGTVLVFELSDTPDDALGVSLSYGTSPTYKWSAGDQGHTMELSIPDEEFRASMTSNTMRCGTLFAESPAGLIDPGDPYVILIAEELLKTCDSSDYSRARTALSFVQNSITYTFDKNLYGCGEFWAKPLETLYLGRGDCEDTSILFCSIAAAMGLDTVLLDYPGHIAAGVKLAEPRGFVYALDGENYCYCETTWDVDVNPGIVPEEYTKSPVRVWEPGDNGLLRDSLNSFCIGYRLSIQRILGI